MLKLLKYMKKYRLESVLAPLFKLIEASFDLTVPIVTALIIDNGIAKGDKTYIFKMCGFLVLLGFLGLAFSITAQFFSAKAAVGFSHTLRHEVFKKIQSFSHTEIDKIGSSTLITRMTSDINQIQNGVNMTLRLFLRSPFIVFGAMIMAFTISFKPALIFVIAIVLLSVIVFSIMLSSAPIYKNVQKKLDGVLSLTRENLNGVRVVRAFCKEDAEIEDFKEQNEKLDRTQQFAGKISALLNPLTYVVINLAIILLIYSGGKQVETGLIQSGDVVALYNYMSQILVELVKLASTIILITKSLACAKRVEAVLQTEPSLEHVDFDENFNKTYKVEFENVSLRYRGAGDNSLVNINFKVLPGETVGIIGSTGSGKTSLVNLIPHFYDATEGRVLVDGHDVKSYDPKVLRKKISVVMQKAVLFKGSIRENMKWGKPNATDEEIDTALKAAQAYDVVYSKDGGLDFELESLGRNLSGGQRQRLTIARALICQSEILILDDSASALDYVTESKLRSSLASLSYKPTVFIVSQRTSSIQSADKIIVLDDGEVCGIGTHGKLLETCEVYKEIYDSQFKK